MLNLNVFLMEFDARAVSMTTCQTSAAGPCQRVEASFLSQHQRLLSLEITAKTGMTASSPFFRCFPTSPRPIPGLTSSSSSARHRLWQRWRFFTEPFLSAFRPFLTRWHTSPLADWVAGLSVIAAQRRWSRDGNSHVGTRNLPAVQSGDSVRAASVYNHTTIPPSHSHSVHTLSLCLSLTPTHTRAHTPTHTHTYARARAHTL